MSFLGPVTTLGGSFVRPHDLVVQCVAEVIGTLDGPPAEVRRARPEQQTYEGSAAGLQDVWVAVRSSLRSLLDHVTIGQIASGSLPTAVTRHAKDPAAWESG